MKITSMLILIHITGTPGNDFFSFSPPSPQTETKYSCADDIQTATCPAWNMHLNMQ